MARTYVVNPVYGWRDVRGAVCTTLKYKILYASRSFREEKSSRDTVS